MSKLKLESGLATDKLLKIIPKEDLEGIVWAYRTIKTFTAKNDIKFLRKGIIDLNRNLDALKRYIPETTKEKMLDTLIDGLIEKGNDDLIHILMALVFNQAKRPKDWAFDVFIWFVLENMAKKKQKPDYDLLASFLSEQHLKDGGLSPRALESRAERLDVDLVRKFMDFFNETGKLRSMPKWECKDNVKPFLKENLLS